MNQKEKEHCRCKVCGFIRYYVTQMSQCPKCGNKDQERMTPSFTNKVEALALFCESFHITPDSANGQRIKEALDIIMENV